jgi:PIN domain nuclease of toxin-antitoxin system
MKLKSTVDCVLDASALMSLINGEPGSALVQRHLDNACISSVNFTEVLGKMLEQGVPALEAKRVLDNFNFEVIAFDEEQILGVSLLLLETKKYGLSLADRVCLNLGKLLNLPVLTSDQVWGKIAHSEIKVILIR